MAADETPAVLCPTGNHNDDFFDPDSDDIHSHAHSHNLSRLSVCTSSMYTTDDGEEAMSRMFMSGLSMESFDAEDDDDDDDKNKRRRANHNLDLISFEDSDSDKEPNWRSLPGTPARGMRKERAAKEYASENEGGGEGVKRNTRRRRLIRERWRGGVSKYEYASNWSGDSDNGGGGMVVITRAKGGKRSLCMDMEEVKACKELGFELEHERMVEVPGRASVSGNSSGGDSPIGNWRISSPGDDPRDVKARLKVWAQAVALASTANPNHPPAIYH